MDEPENEISLTAFRLLTLDLLTLYSVMNEGTINVLGMYSIAIAGIPIIYFWIVSLRDAIRRTLL